MNATDLRIIQEIARRHGVIAEVMDAAKLRAHTDTVHETEAKQADSRFLTDAELQERAS